MNKYVSLLICISIGLILLSGCGSKNTNNSAEGNKDTVTNAHSNQSDEATDWKPTIYETVNNFDGVTMSAKEGTVSSTGLTVILENNSDKQGIYGEEFWVEKKINGSWYQVPIAIDGNYGFPSIGYDLASSAVKEWSVEWEWLYGSLDPGEYRIVKDILDFRKTGDYDEYFLTAEFTIE
jgi:uncharacterized protein YceK